MIDTKDAGVQNFLSELEKTSSEKFAIIQALRAVTFEVDSGISERIMYGGIMFTNKTDFGGIFVSQKHVSFEFSQGINFDDADKQLEGTGKSRRHLKIKCLSEITEKDVEGFVKQAMK